MIGEAGVIALFISAGSTVTVAVAVPEYPDGGVVGAVAVTEAGVENETVFAETVQMVFVAGPEGQPDNTLSPCPTDHVAAPLVVNVIFCPLSSVADVGVIANGVAAAVCRPAKTKAIIPRYSILLFMRITN